MRTLRILEPGPLATVQDRGRFGYQSHGVPQAGAMDPQALRVANALVANDDRAAGIEITLGGLRLQFQCETLFAVTGATRGALLNGVLLPAWQTHEARPGDLLGMDPHPAAATRTYLAVAGGIDLPPVMGSRSTYLRGRFGGLTGRALQPGDLLPLGKPSSKPVLTAAPRPLIPDYSREPLLRAVPGPQDDCFTPEDLRLFFSQSYEVTPRADRMGISLAGRPLELPAGADIISDGTCPGAVQVHGNGLPTILGADCQTTGGYTKIACVISTDLPLVAQLAPGHQVRFIRIDLPAAREIHLRNEFLLKDFERRTRPSASVK